MKIPILLAFNSMIIQRKHRFAAGVLRLRLHGGRGIVKAYEMSHLIQQYVTYDSSWLAIQARENNGEDSFWFHHV